MYKNTQDSGRRNNYSNPRRESFRSNNNDGGSNFRNNDGYRPRRDDRRDDNGYRPRGNNFRNNNNSRFGGRPKKRFMGQNIDPSLFVNNAKAADEVEVYVPKNKFQDFNISEKLKQNIKQKGYITPTPIQDMAIPPIIEGNDVVGIANTGTGKTAAFLVPMINKIMLDSSQKVLIIVPTRELALQIKDEANTFVVGTNINSVLCIGGADIRRQIVNLKRGSNIVIATPGRLKDLFLRKQINLSQYANIVLDEVDRMLDMGFYEDVSFLIGQMTAEKQSLFFSATMNAKSEKIANSLLNNPVKISLKKKETSDHVDQKVIYIADLSKKIEQLHTLLSSLDNAKVLIFNNTKRSVEKLQDNLFEKGYAVVSIHGDKTQAKRQKALDTFKRGKANIMIATDVVARGIDVSDITHVINFDVPNTFEDYIHRIGRTGRGNKSGSAVTFVEKR